MEFEAFRKIRRQSANGIVITEKIDGTNAQIAIDEQGVLRAGSRTRWITPERDNFGFAAWCAEHRDELLQLGPGRHYGEWYGLGIQRGYGLDHKRLALFNTHRPPESLPACVEQVPVLYQGPYVAGAIEETMAALMASGSHVVPGFDRPEGIVTYFHLTRTMIKRTERDLPKGLVDGT